MKKTKHTTKHSNTFIIHNKINKRFYKSTVYSIVIAAFFMITGCTNSLVVEGDFPPPRIDTLPLKLGIHYDKKFRNYAYKEKSKDRSKWHIESGKAQINLFSTVLPRMFEEVVEVNAIPPENTDFKPDLILYPAISEFQYAVPRETKVNIFEVWIKFNLKVFNHKGDLIADWILPAYGKTPTAFLKSKEEAMNEAVVVALRDIGASLSLRFTKIPEIKAWLEQHKAALLKPGQQQNWLF